MTERTASQGISPRDDFYLHVNKEWLDANPIPADESRWGAVTVLRHHTLAQLRAVCEAIPTGNAVKGTPEQIVGNFYNSAIDLEKRNSLGVSPLEPQLSKIELVSSKSELPTLVASLHLIGVTAYMGCAIEEDDKKSGVNAFYVFQGGLGMPNRDYYLNPDRQAVKDQYKEHVVKMFELSGYESVAALNAAKSVMKIEQKLAVASVSAEEERDVSSNYHKFTADEAARDFPNLGWEKYFEAAGVPVPKDFVIRQPAFMAEVNKLYETDSIDEIKDYLKWTVLNTYASTISEDFAKEKFNFQGRVISGAQEMLPLWKQTLQVMQQGIISNALSQLYIREYFKPEAKESLMRMSGNLASSFTKRVNKIDWMDPDTKQLAIAKLNQFVGKLGYPDEWIDDSSLLITDNYAQNVMAAEEFELRRKMGQIGKPVDRNEWAMPPIIVNAYSDYKSEITFPAAILQPPFFDSNADDAYNYGAIGVILGHEITHLVDDMGSQFDLEGNLRNWWPDAVKAAFEMRTERFVDHFGKYAPGGIPVNSRLTLGENISDVGGIGIAFDAYMQHLEDTDSYQIIDGLTPEQRFYRSYAGIWRTNIRPEERRRRATMDRHAPEEVRANGVLSLIPEFYEAYGVKEGDGMFLKPEDRPSLW